jgi:hypothetical protein
MNLCGWGTMPLDTRRKSSTRSASLLGRTGAGGASTKGARSWGGQITRSSSDAICWDDDRQPYILIAPDAHTYDTHSIQPWLGRVSTCYRAQRMHHQGRAPNAIFTWIIRD